MCEEKAVLQDYVMAFFEGMLARGVYPPLSQFEAWFLSAAHTDRHLEQTLTAARAAMKEVARQI